MTEESSKESEADDTYVPCSKFYRYFRILVMGRNSKASAYDCGLALAGLELFGTLEAQSFKTLATRYTPRVRSTLAYQPHITQHYHNVTMKCHFDYHNTLE